MHLLPLLPLYFLAQCSLPFTTTSFKFIYFYNFFFLGTILIYFGFENGSQERTIHVLFWCCGSLSQMLQFFLIRIWGLPQHSKNNVWFGYWLLFMEFLWSLYGINISLHYLVLSTFSLFLVFMYVWELWKSQIRFKVVVVGPDNYRFGLPKKHHVNFWLPLVWKMILIEHQQHLRLPRILLQRVLGNERVSSNSPRI